MGHWSLFEQALIVYLFIPFQFNCKTLIFGDKKAKIKFGIRISTFCPVGHLFLISHWRPWYKAVAWYHSLNYHKIQLIMACIIIITTTYLICMYKGEINIKKQRILYMLRWGHVMDKEILWLVIFCSWKVSKYSFYSCYLLFCGN